MEHDLQSRPLHARLLALLVLITAVGLGLHGPIVQWAGYHAFADARAWGALPNALNVLSNLPFAIIGTWGWWRLRGERGAWRACAAAIAATAVGSVVYHWNPTDWALVIDRLPIAWACALLTCAFFGERVHARWNSTTSVAGVITLACAAVGWWAWAGDLRPYVLVQFTPMLLIPAALLLQMRPLHNKAVPAAAWGWALGIYAGAKVLEMSDAGVLQALHVVSGHSLKHLLAAGAAAVLLHARVSCGDQPR